MTAAATGDGAEVDVDGGHADCGGHVVVERGGFFRNGLHDVDVRGLGGLPVGLHGDVVVVRTLVGGTVAEPDEFHRDGVLVAGLETVLGVFGIHGLLEFRLNLGADGGERSLRRAAHVDHQRAVGGAALGRIVARGHADGVGRLFSLLVEVPGGLEVGDRGDRAAHGHGGGRTCFASLPAGGFRVLDFEAVGADVVDDGVARHRAVGAEVGDDVEGVVALAGFLAVAVELLHAAEVALAFLTRRAADPDVVDRTDVVLLHELGGLHDGDRVDHGVLEARHVDAVAALLLGFLEVVEAVVGLLPDLVLDHLAVLVEADFKGERLEFLARLDDRVAHLLELDGFVRGFGRRQDARVHGVDVAFKDDLRELALVGDGVGTGAVGAGDAHADVVDGLAVNGLNAGALEEAVGTGHDVFRRKAPLLDETAGDFGLTAHFKARRGGDAGKLEQRVEAPLLGLRTRGLLQQGLHGGVGVHEFGVLCDRVGDDRNGGRGRKDGRADARGQKAGNKFHLDSPHFGCGWSGAGRLYGLRPACPPHLDGRV